MLQVHECSKSYGALTVLDKVSFVVNPNDRAALVGPNGCGKSTLLNIIGGLEEADSGMVTFDQAATLGYLRQGLTPSPGLTVLSAACEGVAGWHEARGELDEIARWMAAPGADVDQLLGDYERTQAWFDSLGGYDIEHRAEAMLSRFGLPDLDQPVETLSGGQQTRLMLAGVLLAEPDLLLLDEPTNHLDIDMLEWLEEFLAAYNGAVLIVSHDRTFLDRTVTRIIEIDQRTHEVTEYTGNYSEYAAQKAASIDRQWSAWKDQRAEERRMRQDIHRTKMHAQSVELTTTSREPGVRRAAKKVAKKALSREKKLDRYLESDERVGRPDRHWQVKIDFGEMPRGGQEVATLKGIGHSFDGDRWLFRDLNLTLRHGERIALLGPNGSGKSTLLRVMVGALEPSEGTVRPGANVRIGYMPQKQETLDPESTPFEIIRQAAAVGETDIRNFLHYFLFAGDDVFAPVGRLSYGERARLLLARLVIGGANWLVLDEPVNHLDIASRERFEEALDSFPGTVLAAVHDRAFIDRFASGIWRLEGGRIARYIDRAEMSRVRG
ncbi:MAG: ABC-F family ATP-binding cassette domain-containing protein [Anaerolineae bacterium]|nr:ABC-F family ATP-binding cassette domain-containing protein [Anaerolineae bacterium]